jgi:hypothetical protein
MEAAIRPNDGGALDFAHVQLMIGECLRRAAILDEFTGEIVLTPAATAFKPSCVRELLKEAREQRVVTSQWRRSDNGSELVANQSSACRPEMGIHHARSTPRPHRAERPTEQTTADSSEHDNRSPTPPRSSRFRRAIARCSLARTAA